MGFKHFPKETIAFYNDLVKNNNKDWFENNRQRYNDFVITPAKDFINELGPRLESIAPGLLYEPKINKSIYKIHRDARFHKGQAPFKTNLGLLFYADPSRMSSSCFYFMIEPPFYSFSVGMIYFEPDVLAEYRRSIADPKLSKELISICDKAKNYGITMGGKQLKTLPRAYAKAELSEKQAELIRYEALYMIDEMPINEDFYKDSFIDEAFDACKRMNPYHLWLSDMIKRASAVKMAREQAKLQ